VATTATKVFADLTNVQFVASTKGTGPKTSPVSSPFHQDKLYLSIQPLVVEPSGSQTQNPYQVLDASGYSITVLIITADASATTLAGPTVMASVDGTAMAGSVDLNTAAMATAFTSSATTSVDAKILVQIDNGSTQKITVSGTLTINRTYITGSTPSALPLPSYLTRDECIALFVKYAGNPPGASVTLTDSTSTYQTVWQCNSDGSNASDAIR
jgi:hypothetical protein